MFRSKEFYRRQHISWRYIFFFLWCLLSQPVAAWADDALIASAFLEDPSNALTVDEVQSAKFDAQFTPFLGILNRGYSNSAFWLKLQIPAGTSRAQARGLWAPGDGDNYLLRIQPS